jgi:hypothetical protein
MPSLFVPALTTTISCRQSIKALPSLFAAPGAWAEGSALGVGPAVWQNIEAPENHKSAINNAYIDARIA